MDLTETVRSSATDDEALERIAIALKEKSLQDILEVERGMWYSRGDSCRTPPLNSAADLSYVKTAKFLLHKGHDVNSHTSLGATPLMIACRRGSRNMVRLLIDSDANVDSVDSDGEGGLYSAVVEGFEDIVRMLLEARANPNLPTQTGTTALFAAASLGRCNIVDMLLRCGADCEKAIEGTGQTPLLMACTLGNTNLVEQLTEFGADVNHCSSDGSSPLIVAAANGRKAVVDLLLRIDKLDYNARNNRGMTALYCAVQNNHAEIVYMLLEAGADPSIAAKDLSSPLYLAHRVRNGEIVALLRHAGASFGLPSSAFVLIGLAVAACIVPLLPGGEKSNITMARAILVLLLPFAGWLIAVKRRELVSLRRTASVLLRKGSMMDRGRRFSRTSTASISTYTASECDDDYMDREETSL